jgi:hypothetical protein
METKGPMNTTSATLIAVLFAPIAAIAQQFGTRTGDVSFFSETPVENIAAVNHKASCVLDVDKGEVEVSMLMKAFEFEKAKMQEDFNESYVESDTYPKCTMKGKVKGITPAELKKGGVHKVQVDGEITLHGVTKPMVLDAEINVDPQGAMTVTSAFILKPEDFKINIPAIVREKIAREVQVKVKFELSKL